MRALLYDLTLLDNDDLVSVPDGAESMGDDDDSLLA